MGDLEVRPARHHLDDEGWLDRTWPPDAPGLRLAPGSASPESASARASTSCPPGQSTFPYHYELGNDELLVVVKGRPTLRTPEGERVLEPGEAALSSGPDGAHRLTNRATEPVRVLIVSSFALPRAAVQVESNKLMIRWGTGEGERRWFFLDDAAGYWDGEAAPEGG